MPMGSERRASSPMRAAKGSQCHEPVLVHIGGVNKVDSGDGDKGTTTDGGNKGKMKAISQQENDAEQEMMGRM